MKTINIWISVVTLLGSAAQAGAQPRADVRHLPGRQVHFDEPELEVEVLDAQQVAEIRVLYRTRRATGEPAVAVFERDADGWFARLDQARLDAERGIDYWIVMQ